MIAITLPFLSRTLAIACISAVIGISALTAHDAAADEVPNLGVINFPNSGSEAAQTTFLTGVKAFHSFEFEDAGVAFRETQDIDPTFALAYWGEALSLNHPLWNETNPEAAQAILKRFAPTPESRSQKTPGGRERGLMEAVEFLFGPGDKLSRDLAYSEAMGHLHQQYPEDDEIATLHALSILGTVRPGDKGFRRQMQAGAIALQVYERNPNHPGAAHFIIHAFDDPEHAILALPAAKRYAEIAPDAAHALHMPSHIFVQLGMWDGVVASNDASYKVALNDVEQKGHARGRSEYHALQWYHYGQLQLGNIEKAQWALDEAFRTLDAYPTERVRNGTLMMLARNVLETERWKIFNHDILTDRDDVNAGVQFVAGLSAIHTGDKDMAYSFVAKLTNIRRSYEQNPTTAYMAEIIAVGESELQAAIAQAQGDIDAAEDFLLKATAIEETLNAPSGPPLPMKPAFEMYGEFLLEQGRLEEAAVQFKKALERTPNRTQSVRGLKNAEKRPSDTASLQ